MNVHERIAHRKMLRRQALPAPRPKIIGRATLLCGDAREQLQSLSANSIDGIVTDPPYALVSIVKRFGNPACEPAKGNQAFVRASRGFMGQTWDTGSTAHDPAFWFECLRVVKPGGFMLAFGGTRTYHRLACAIEDAGFEVRDMVQWLYGSGFPKSHDEGEGWGTALKPACEPICMARKPLSEDTVAANVLRWGTGAINIDGCRVGFRERPKITDPKQTSNTYGVIDNPGGKLLPASRWPANVITDGSDEVVAAFPTTSASPRGAVTQGKRRDGSGWDRPCNEDHDGKGVGYGDSGSAARFFYQAKATKKERAGSKHPTVKPIALLRYLCRLIIQPGGLVLDPFAGTGTLGQAAHLEGMRSVMIEREAEYQDDIRCRIAALNMEMFDGQLCTEIIPPLSQGPL